MRLSEAFGQVLREERERMGVSQEELAHRAQMHTRAISFYERGLRTPTLQSVFLLGKALGLEAHELVAKVGKKRPAV